MPALGKSLNLSVLASGKWDDSPCLTEVFEGFCEMMGSIELGPEKPLHKESQRKHIVLIFLFYSAEGRALSPSTSLSSSSVVMSSCILTTFVVMVPFYVLHCR